MSTGMSARKSSNKSRKQGKPALKKVRVTMYAAVRYRAGKLDGDWAEGRFYDSRRAAAKATTGHDDREFDRMFGHRTVIVPVTVEAMLPETVAPHSEYFTRKAENARYHQRRERKALALLAKVEAQQREARRNAYRKSKIKLAS